MYYVLKWIGFIVGGLVGLAALALGVIYLITDAQLNKTYEILVVPLPIPSDPASIARGKHLVNTIGLCAECHGDHLAGQIFDEGLFVGRIAVANLTTGQGGVGRTFSDTDWVRALRHGVGLNGKTLVDMPSNYYYHFSDTDLSAVIAYLKTLPPQDNELPPIEVGPLARIFLLQDPSLLPAQVIDHAGPRPVEPEPGVTLEYGQYLAHFCRPCHGENLAGQDGAGAGQNLTPGGELSTWTEADFMNTLRTGINPQGHELDPEMMPWPSLGKLSDDELKAIWLYLQSLPPVTTESR